MGYLKQLHGVTLIGKTPEGTCPECGVKHEAYNAHDKDSLCYQYKFYDKHGRFPTWEDAMAHCPEEVKKVWLEALEERGVSIK